MVPSNSIIIASTLHEPEFRLKGLIEAALPYISENLKTIIVSCTSTTDKDAIAYLTAKGFIISIPTNDTRIVSYSDAIKVAVGYIESPESQRILYVDFDRLVHWINNYPDELTRILKDAETLELLHMGRSKRAYKTHPNTQQDTEQIINYLGSQTLDFKETKDWISVCYSFTTQLADLILNKRYVTEMGFYLTWPIILWKYAEKKRYIEVEGQEWETPDRYEKEIRDLGYEKWLEQFQSASEWKKRVKLLEDCVIEMYYLLKS